MTPALRHPITETELQARIRLGRDTSGLIVPSGRPATERQLMQGAAAEGTYYPPPAPPAAIPMAWVVTATLAAIILVGVLGLLV